MKGRDESVAGVSVVGIPQDKIIGARQAAEAGPGEIAPIVMWSYLAAAHHELLTVADTSNCLAILAAAVEGNPE